jgi:hypothetical protein
METSARISITIVGLAACACGPVRQADAQFWSDYTVQRLGLFGPEQTASNGNQLSSVTITPEGRIYGTSNRYVGTQSRGRDVWISDGNSTVQLGRTGPGYISANGYQSSYIAGISSEGIVTGASQRWSDAGSLGQEAWVWSNGVYQRIGLMGGPYTGSDGYEISGPHSFYLPSGQVLGDSSRVIDGNNLGQDHWIWDGETTQQIGLFGEGYVGTSGIQNSLVSSMTESGLLLGRSTRYKGESTENGEDPWVYDPVTRATTQLGLTGEGYTGSEGYQYSEIFDINPSGLVVGLSVRISGVQASVGGDMWIWDGHTYQTIGLRDPENIFLSGGSSDKFTKMNSLGHVLGASSHYDPSGAWVGDDSWVWDGSATIRLGFFGFSGMGSPGSGTQLLNNVGQVAAYSDRYGTSGDFLGRGAWLWNGHQVVQLGFTDSVYLRSDGFRRSDVKFLTDSGFVAGSSERYRSSDQWYSGYDTWIYNGSFTYQIGLRGGVYTKSNTYQRSDLLFLSESGHAAGVSFRFTSADADAGQDAWVWDGSTTRQIGLTGGAYTSSTGYQYSNILFSNASGCLVGISNANGNTTGGGVWYYDPATGQQHTVAASGSAQLLRDDGVLFGTYANSTTRPFIYRPDFGLIDLVDLAEGGLAAQGWRSLTKVVSVGENFESFVGLGFVTGQPGSSPFQGSVFLMRAPVCPECPADFDNNGGVDGGDLAAFMEDYETSGRCADVDANGGIDGGDLAAFFLAFEQGGC